MLWWRHEWPGIEKRMGTNTLSKCPSSTTTVNGACWLSFYRESALLKTSSGIGQGIIWSGGSTCRRQRIRPEPETPLPEMKPLWQEIEDARRAGFDKKRAENPEPPGPSGSRTPG